MNISKFKNIKEQRDFSELIGRYDDMLAINKNIKEQRDFSELIGRYEDALAIKGRKIYLISYLNGDILYTNDENIKHYNDKITYKIGKLKDVRIGDVFIFKDKADTVDIYDIYEFKIFFGKNFDKNYIAQHIQPYYGAEIISFDFISKEDENEDVIIFNRY